MQALPSCKYGANCYRKNPAHLAQFSHPGTPLAKGDSQDSGNDEPAAKRPRPSPCPASPTSVTATAASSRTAGGNTEQAGSQVDSAVATAASSQASTSPAASPAPSNDDGDCESIDLTQCPAYVTGDETSREATADWLREAYGVPFPADFFCLWDFCYGQCPASPKDALKPLLGVKLMGPYDFLAGLFADESILSVKSVHLHHRFYFDQPELLTILAEDKEDGQHLGYFRDDPSDAPAFVALSSNWSDCTLAPVANNALAAVVFIADKLLEREKNKAKVSELKTLRDNLTVYAAQHNCPVSVKNVDHLRSKKIVGRPLNRIGIVVPYDKEEDVGYRPLPMTNGKLKTLLDRIAQSKTKEERERHGDDLHQIVTFVQFANDECDYGMGLELGIDLFAHGSKVFHSTLSHLLPTAYELLGRDTFARVIRLHLANRTKSISI